MQIDILTLFPDMFAAPLGQSIIGRAVEGGRVDIRCHQIRDFTENRQNQVDDYPYGGGMGCVMQAQPLYSCWQYAMDNGPKTPLRTIYLSPAGKPFQQADARRLATDYGRLILVCGHYEGVDERFIDRCVDEEISIGDYVLTGGEIPAMAVADAVCRLLPGVLADETCFTEESHWTGLLEYPQYSRPEIWEGAAVPDVLRTGDHGAIARWRRLESLKRTLLRRPDLFERLLLTKEDLKLIALLKEQVTGSALSLIKNLHADRITVRQTTERDRSRLKELPCADRSGMLRDGTHYCIYAEGLGFCGEAGFDRQGETAEVFLFLLPHARGKGIGTFALERVIRDGFDRCVVSRFFTREAPARFWTRLQFSPGAGNMLERCREDRNPGGFEDEGYSRD